MIKRHKDKDQFKCDQCAELRFSYKYEWYSWITESTYFLCSKCVQREFGKKNYEKLKDRGFI
jgi:hypothetical protein